MAEKSKNQSPEKLEDTAQGLSRWRAVRDDTYRLVYVNAHRMRLRGNELAVTFSTIADIPADTPGIAEQVLQEQATLMMPYQHVKLLQIELTALVEEYEKIVGEITVSETNKGADERVRSIAKGAFGAIAKERSAPKKTK